MNDLAVFDFNGNNVRTLVVDRKPMFVAKDVADVLGYVRPDEAVSAHCRYVDKTSILKHSKMAGSSNYKTLCESGYSSQ
ncbi:BRO-N domain-containing protein [Photobacterium lipolyticum]|nr:BRO family protein [Photobacterium lipolyticum]